MMANASRSWAPTPTSRRTASVCGSSTTRHTSSPRTSPVTTPCSTFGVGTAGHDRRDQREMGRRRLRRWRGQARPPPAAARGRRRATRRSGVGTVLARRASTPVSVAASRWRRSAPVADRPGQCRTESVRRIVLHQHPCRCRRPSPAAPGGNTPGPRRRAYPRWSRTSVWSLSDAQAAARSVSSAPSHGAAVTSSWSSCGCRSAC